MFEGTTNVAAEPIDLGEALKALSAEGGVRPRAQNLTHW